MSGGGWVNLTLWQPARQPGQKVTTWLPDVAILRIYRAWLREQVELAKLEERVNG